jgi:hypothetical protein
MDACKLLSQPDVNGLQVCLEWVAVNQSILPPLTLEQSTYLGLSFWVVCIVAKGFRELGYLIKKF